MDGSSVLTELAALPIHAPRSAAVPPSSMVLTLPIVSAALVVASIVAIFLWRPFADPAASPRAAVPPPPGSVAAARAYTPQAILQIPRGTAQEINRTNPVIAGPNPAAAGFTGVFGNASAFDRAAHCLTAAVYYEAANESDDGQRAVAQVVLNRVRHPAYPNSVCGVVWQGSNLRTGCQFSFTCDGSLARTPSQSGWARARQVALAALGGSVFAPVGLSTHYHADYVVPYWQASLTKTAVIGAHIFYRWPRGAGTPAAFNARYSGTEPDISAQGGTAGESAKLTGAAPTTGEIWAEQPALLKPKLKEEEAHTIDAFGLLDFRKPRAAVEPPTTTTVAVQTVAPVAKRPEIESAVASAVAQSGGGQ